jgi:hypothetical protein
LTDIIARVVVIAIAAIVVAVYIIVVVHMHVTVFFRMTDVQIGQAGWEANEFLLTVVVVQIIRLHMLR